jgi:VCBS repeat-containing protein
MEKGKHELQVEFFERGGLAQISMDIDKTTVSTGQYWNGTYWFNRTMDSEWALIKSVDRLDFDWGSGSPALGLPKDHYSIRWERTVEFEPGVYRFYARADDGIRAEVDGDRIIDEWHTSNASETYMAEIPLSGLHDLLVEYFEQSGKAKIAVWWEYLGPQNRHPIANSDDYKTVADEVFIVAEPGVMGNDKDPDGDTLTTKLVTGPINGMIVLNEDGSFEYQPAPGFVGEDMFTYRVSDGELESNDALVMLTVLASNSPPVASDDTFARPQGEPIDIAAPGVLENDVDDDAQELKAYLEAETSHGSIILCEDGSFLYSPDPEFTGTDHFTYRVSDGQALSNIATVTINLIPQNAAPVAVDDAFEVEEGGVLVVAAPGILENDVDPEGQPLQVVLEDSPLFGDLTLGEDGAFEYIPRADFNGDDAFSYRVSDGEVVSEIANVQIQVTPVNHVPQATADEVSGIQDQALEIMVLSNDDGLGDAPIAIIIDTTPMHGELEILGDTILYTPNPGFFGEDVFSYSVMDQDGEHSQASVSIIVNPLGS